MLEELKSRYPDTEEGERRGVACYTEDSGRTQMQEGFYRVTDYHEAFVIMAEDDTRLGGIYIRRENAHYTSGRNGQRTSEDWGKFCVGIGKGADTENS